MLCGGFDPGFLTIYGLFCRNFGYIVLELGNCRVFWIDAFELGECSICFGGVAFLCVSDRQVLQRLNVIRIGLERAVEFLDRPVIIWRIAENERQPEVGANIDVIGLFGKAPVNTIFRLRR